MSERDEWWNSRQDDLARIDDDDLEAVDQWIQESLLELNMMDAGMPVPVTRRPTPPPFPVQDYLRSRRSRS